jgi:hypothetical protein
MVFYQHHLQPQDVGVVLQELTPPPPLPRSVGTPAPSLSAGREVMPLGVFYENQLAPQDVSLVPRELR